MPIEGFVLSDRAIYFSTVALLGVAVLAWRLFHFYAMIGSRALSRRQRWSILNVERNKLDYWDYLMHFLDFIRSEFKFHPFSARLYEACAVLALLAPFGLVFLIWLLTGESVSFVLEAFAQGETPTTRFFCFVVLYATIAAAILAQKWPGWTGVILFCVVVPMAIASTLIIQKTGIGSLVGASILAASVGTAFFGWRVLLFGAPFLAFTVADAVGSAFEGAALPFGFELTGYVVMVLVTAAGGLVQKLLNAFESQDAPDYVRNIFWMAFTVVLFLGAVAASYLAQDDKRSDLFYIIVIYFAIIPFATAPAVWGSCSLAIFMLSKSASRGRFGSIQIVAFSAVAAIILVHCVAMTALLQLMNNLSSGRGRHLLLDLSDLFSTLRNGTVPLLNYRLICIVFLSAVPLILLYFGALLDKYAFRTLPVGARLFIDSALRRRRKMTMRERSCVISLLLLRDFIGLVVLAGIAWSLSHLFDRLAGVASLVMSVCEATAMAMGANIVPGPFF